MSEGVPTLIEDLAAACVKAVSKALGVELDYTSDTLPVLDHYLLNVPRSGKQELLDLIVPMAGAYFGEVVRRARPGCRWGGVIDAVATEGVHPSQFWRLEFEHVFLHLNPAGAALEALERKAVEGWNAHFATLAESRGTLEEAFASTEGISSDDYHRLAVRFDSLEHALDVLTDLSRHRQQTERIYTAEDYSKAIAMSLN